MSFPSILRNPGISDRFAHLRAEIPSAQAGGASAAARRRTRDDKEGKRWIRRKENARFTGNPHIVLATKKDYALPLNPIQPTFPEPLPPYLPRNAQVPAAPPPSADPLSANAGRFSLSLKGMRRDLRKAGGRAEFLVGVVEDEIVDWLENGGVMTAAQVNGERALEFPGRVVGDVESIREVSRTPLELVWAITDDAFARYVVHCCARYHEVVSFSKDTSGQRLTHLLRPNVTRPDHTARASVATPPVTDLSASDISSDFEFSQSDRELESDVERPRRGGLEAITEASVPSSPAVVPLAPIVDDGWSVVGGESDREGEADDSGVEDLSRPMDALSLAGHQDPDRTPLAAYRAFRSVTSSWASPGHRARSGSSPSPARRASRRAAARKVGVQKVRKDAGTAAAGKPKSFYEYLFA